MLNRKDDNRMFASVCKTLRGLGLPGLNRGFVKET